MMISTKFASLVGSVTLAFVLASSLHSLSGHSANAMPINVERQDPASASEPAAAPAGFISVAQPQMSEQDIYAMGIPDDPAPTPAAAPDQLSQLMQAAAQAALSATNNTMAMMNRYDATASTAGSYAVVPQDQGMTGNPAEGDLYKQVIGTAAAPAADVAATPESSTEANFDAYRQIIAEQMQQFGAKTRRALSEALMTAKRDALGVGVPTPLAATSTGDATTAALTIADMAGVPVAAPVPADYSTPTSASVAGDAPAVSAPAASATAVSASAPAASISALTSDSVSASVSASASATLDPSAAAAVTVMPTSDATALPTSTVAAAAAVPTGDLTMTVTVPPGALPTSIPNANANLGGADDLDEWKTMTILVPAEAFGGSPVPTSADLPATNTAGISSSSPAASSTGTTRVDPNDAAVSSSASSKASPTEAPINLSTFSPMKPAATNILTIPLTGVIDGTTYSTMLTLTIPGLSTSVPAASTTAVVSASSKANSAVASATGAPTKTSALLSSSSSSSVVAPTSSVDPSFINPDDVPPLLKSSSIAPSVTSAPNATPTSTQTNDDCDEEEDATAQMVNTAQPKSLLTKVWDWITGKSLQERELDADEYDYEDEDEDFFDAE